MVTFTLNAPEFKKLNSPTTHDDGHSRYICYVQAKSIPSNIDEWFGTNPREQKMTTDVARKIKTSLSENANFHELNRGIVFSAKSAEWDNKTKYLKLIFEDTTVHGNIDGGHTLRAILDATSSNSLPDDRFVLLEIFTGLSSPIELADARNRSVPVDLKSLEELQKSFDPLKSVLNGLPFEHRIQYKMNEHYNDDPKLQTIDVREIISIIIMFSQEIYPLKTNGAISPTQPIQSYSGKEASLRRFLHLNSNDAAKQKANREEMLSNMSPIVKDIFSLWEKIETSFADAAKKSNKLYGARKYSKYDKDKFVGQSFFGNVDLKYVVPKGIMYPLVSAFRALVELNPDGTYKWQKAPDSVWDDIGPTLVSIILDEKSDGPEAIAKNSNVWSNLFKEVYIHAHI